MIDYLLSLGTIVKENRIKMGLTQNKLAELADIDAQTVQNIELFRTDPKLSGLFSLVRALQIDPRTFFYPEQSQTQDAMAEVELLLADCSEEQIRTILPVIRAALDLLKAKDGIAVK